jgi:hypothetical protein
MVLRARSYITGNVIEFYCCDEVRIPRSYLQVLRATSEVRIIVTAAVRVLRFAIRTVAREEKRWRKEERGGEKLEEG